MPDYQAPLRDMRFVMDELFDYPAHYARLARLATTFRQTWCLPFWTRERALRVKCCCR